MTTINIHKDKLLPAAFAYQQRKLKEIMIEQEKMIDTLMTRWIIFFRPRNRVEAFHELLEESVEFSILRMQSDDLTKEYVKLQTACGVAEDGIVSLAIDVVQRIFGEEL